MVQICLKCHLFRLRSDAISEEHLFESKHLLESILETVPDHLGALSSLGNLLLFMHQSEDEAITHLRYG